MEHIDNPEKKAHRLQAMQQLFKELTPEAVETIDALAVEASKEILSLAEAKINDYAKNHEHFDGICPLHPFTLQYLSMVMATLDVMRDELLRNIVSQQISDILGLEVVGVTVIGPDGKVMGNTMPEDLHNIIAQALGESPDKGSVH